jgi:hypothetical protein
MTEPTPPRRPRGRPRTSGKFTCDRCWRPTGKIRLHWPDGAICGICFHEATRTFGSCDRCRAERMLPGRSGDERLCRTCAGITTDLDCTRCRTLPTGHLRPMRPARRPRGAALRRRRAPPRAAAADRGALRFRSAREHPHTWKRHPDVVSLLTKLGTGELTLSHDAIDQMPGQAREHLRELLVHHELLPQRDRDLARFEAWLEERLKAFDDKEIRQSLAQFATWHHLRKIRRKAARGHEVHGSVHYAKQEITEVGRLLTWLQSQDVTLATCAQGHIDQWVAEGPTSRSLIRTFINWARRNKHAKGLKLQARTPRSSPLITHEKRLDWLATCLRDEPDTLSYRVAAVFLLLYAQPLVRIAALRCDQISITPEGVFITLGKEPAAVPSPFAELVIDLIKTRPNLQTGNGGVSPWLFPSTRTGHHLDPNTIMVRLRSLGIELLGSRNAALRELVQQVPPPIVASQLGYGPPMALRHAALVAQPDARYAALAAKQLGLSNDRAHS